MRVPLARKEADRLLLQGRWHPVTERLTFIAGDTSDVVAEYDARRSPGELSRTGYGIRIETVTGDLEQLLQRLLPLQMIGDRRFLFVPVDTDGPYRTAMFGDSWGGSDTSFTQAAFAGWGFGGVEVRSCPDDTKRRVWLAGFHGIHELGVVWPVPRTDEHPRGYDGRLVGIRDTGRWIFVDHGTPLPFEGTTTYTAPRIRDRFSQQTLIDYAAALGLRPFDEDFYAPDHTATLVTGTRPGYYGNRLMSLTEAQGRRLDAVGIPDPDAITERPPDEPTRITYLPGPPNQ